MSDAFIAGGWGMYPTLIAGLALLATSLRYASRPESRYVPLMITLGLFTLFAGGLGFVTGVISLPQSAFFRPPADKIPSLMFVGIQESLNNIALALLLTTVSALAASVGAWRISQQVPSATSQAR